MGSRGFLGTYLGGKHTLRQCGRKGRPVAFKRQLHLGEIALLRKEISGLFRGKRQIKGSDRRTLPIQRFAGPRTAQYHLPQLLPEGHTLGVPWNIEHPHQISIAPCGHPFRLQMHPIRSGVSCLHDALPGQWPAFLEPGTPSRQSASRHCSTFVVVNR